MNRKIFTWLLFAGLLISSISSTHANERRLTPFERIQKERDQLQIEAEEASANELIPQILERTGLQYTFIRSEEERIVSLKTQADPVLALETVAFAAGFNIHKNGNYWVIHPLPSDENVIN